MISWAVNVNKIIGSVENVKFEILYNLTVVSLASQEWSVVRSIHTTLTQESNKTYNE